MTRIPVRLRLTLAFAVAMAFVLAGVGIFVYHRVSRELLTSVDQALAAQGREAATRGHVDADATGGTTLAQFLGPDDAVLSSDPGGLPPLLGRADVDRARLGARVWRTEHIRGRRGEWRVLALPAGEAGVAVVARSLAARAESLDHLRHELVLILPLALLVSALGGYALAAAALRPVEAMRRRAAAVTADRPARLPVPSGGDELSRLAITLNEMLDRLHAAFAHERRFVADASHELRTPLALLRTELELALRRPRPPEELEAALRSAADETDRLSRLAEDLLLIARADQGPLPIRPEPLEVSRVLADVARRFATRAADLGRSILAAPGDAVADADLLRVEQALANLVDNALQHGAGDVELVAEESGDLVVLHVLDRGPGFAEAFRERAFDRFSRADDARTGAGAGLGLSIVDVIARAHGGRAQATNRGGGGADVWFSVPRAQAPAPRPSRLRDLRPESPAPSPQGIGRTPDRAARGL